MINNKQVEQIVKDKLGLRESDFDETSRFRDDLGADSLDLVEIIMECEREFNVSIPDSVADQIVTVGDLARICENSTI